MSCTKLVDADFTFVNSRLAEYYSRGGWVTKPLTPITGARGSVFERVALVPDNRRACGILTHGSILLTNSNGVDSHPVKRGAWVLRTLFDSPPPEPPAEVPAIDEASEKAKGLTLAQQLELHNTRESCKACHQRIDPWGMAFEQYDAIGAWRDRVEKITTSDLEYIDEKTGEKKTRKHKQRHESTVKSEVTLPDGKTIHGVEGLRDYILTAGRERFQRAIVRKVLSYALGRSLSPKDRQLVDHLTEVFEKEDMRLQPLILAVVQSEAFRQK